MDPGTHTLLGLTLAQSGLGRRDRLATAALVIGANLPDVDAFLYLGGGSDLALWCRRGWTHGVLALALWPFVLTGLLLAYARWRPAEDGRRSRAGTLLPLSCLALLTHPTLDWLNTYGLRWLMPFDGRWFYGDAWFIADPWVWLTLGGALFFGAPAGRRSAATWAVVGVLMSLLVLGPMPPRAARIVWVLALFTLVAARFLLPRTAPDRWARLALAAVTLYAVTMLGLSRAGSRIARAELARRGITELDGLMVGPLPANPFLWEVVVATPEAYRFGWIDWIAQPRFALDTHTIPRLAITPVIGAARDAPSVRGFVNWARFPWYEVEESPAGFTVHMMDARYARGRRRGFGGATVELDRELHPSDR